MLVRILPLIALSLSATNFLAQVTSAAEPAAPVTSSPHHTLHEFFMNSPLRGANLNLDRIEDYPRTVEFG